MGDVKSSRPYNSARRRQQAQQSRHAILQAARRRFLTNGYRLTTIAAIAEEASVSVDTIYKTFRSKAGLLKTLYDIAIVGDDEPVPMAERPAVKRWKADPDPQRIITEYCDLFAQTASRVMPILLLVRSAAGDPDADTLWNDIRRERLTGMGMMATNLHSRRLLAPDLDADKARDILWLHTSPETYEQLVLDRSWTLDQYRALLTDTLCAALLPTPPQSGGTDERAGWP